MTDKEEACIAATQSALASNADLPDSTRNRFVGCSLLAARLALIPDVPQHEIESRLWALMSLMSVNLKEWAKELKA